MRKNGEKFSSRVRAGQAGNVVAYMLGFAVLWFVFFTVKGWIKETKEARHQKRTVQQQAIEQGRNDFYSNPYDR